MSKNDTLMRLDDIIKQKNWTYYKLGLRCQKVHDTFYKFVP